MSNGNEKYFIDSHCHLFNIDHIPIFTLLERANLNVLKFGALATDLNKILAQHRGFITFFEREISENIKHLTDEINSALTIPTYKKRERILCPLIMDFEKIPEASHERLSNQVSRLLTTLRQPDVLKILSQVGESGVPYKILPFLGLDLRRFKSKNIKIEQINSEVIKFLNKHNVSFKSAADRKDLDKLENGDVIGIKLYPPIGFDPYPEDPVLRGKYIKVFEYFNKKEIPFTVHCQKGSYQPNSVTGKDLENFTTPSNWEKVLAEIPDLRINFAHFGGEDSVKRTVRWENDKDDSTNKFPFYGINGSTWTYTIIKLLKKYKNTYADISAFDYADRDALLALSWLLTLDDNRVNWQSAPRMESRRLFEHASGKLKSLGNYALKDKLLWGSDYPMMLGNEEFSNYKKLLSSFYKAIDVRTINHKEKGAPMDEFPYSKGKFPNKKDLWERLTNSNPKRFLFDCR